MLKTSHGFTLIELLVSLALGMIVIFAVSSIAIGSYQSNLSTTADMDLAKEIDRSLEVLSKEIRRAGYSKIDNDLQMQKVWLPASQNDIQTDPNSDGDIACFIYRYDFDNDGTLDANSEVNGFFFNDEATTEKDKIKILTDGDASTNSCSSGTWKAISTSSKISIIAASITPSSSCSGCTINSFTLSITGKNNRGQQITRTETVKMRNKIVLQ